MDIDPEHVRRMIRMATGKEARYRKEGDCTRCGACCANEDCEHFTPATETELAACAIWGDPERDLKCIEWPYNPPVSLATCGYKFVDMAVAPGEEERVLGYKED